jgi:hypothetical protein
MTTQSTISRHDALEQAILTVIHDARIPKTLRTALGVYRRRWAEPNNPEAGTMRPGHTEVTCLPEIFRSSDADPYPCISPGFAHEDDYLLSSESAVIEQGLRIRVRFNKPSLDWSVEINGHRNESVTSEIMEALIESAVVAAVTLLMRAFSRRTQ